MPDQKPHERRRRPAEADITPSTPIWCPWCEADHPASAFNRETRRYSGLSGICRDAQAEKRQLPKEKERNALKNKKRWQDPEYRAHVREASKRWYARVGTEDLRKARARLRRLVDDWKRRGCADCGYADIRAIDPDHTDPDDKHGNLSRMVQLCASEARIRAELEKCVARCARCHRRDTWDKRPSSWRSAERVPPSWRRRLELQDFNDELKLSLGCADCGWNGWARGLDWDHARGAKLRMVAKLINDRWPVEVLIAETAKCDVVCANCHRIRTSERRASSALASDGRCGTVSAVF